MMTDEEVKPLIGSFKERRQYFDRSNTKKKLEEPPVKLRAYGSSFNNSDTVIPPEGRIVYTWSEINVFATDAASKKKNFLNSFKRSVPVNALKKHILKNVNGIAYPGELLAILGSSGAGKTTLLNALTFRSSGNSIVTGLRCVNGTPVGSGSLTSQSAYVQQDDLFIGNLTVKEHLIFQALVRMDRHVSYKQRMKRVEEVISELGLAKCQNTKIGIPGRIPGISGGERKRLSFAAEVLTNPSLMFCDEPTSGLDSFMALNVVQVLKNMAQKGKTILFTIHQPSSELFLMFDKILLLSEGRTAFLGSPEEAEEFFTRLESPCPRNYNPADYFMQLLAVIPDREEACKQAINMICDSYDKSDLGIKTALEAGYVVTNTEPGYYDFWQNGETHRNPYKASWCMQFRAVLWRSWLSVIKEPLLIKVRVVQTIMTALVIGAIYFRQQLDQVGVMNINGVLFLFLTSMTFQNLFAVINVFCSELPVFLREQRNGMYRTDVYFLCKTFAELPLFIFLPVLYTSVAYYLIGLNPELPRFLLACGVMILAANAAISFGYLISCASSSISMALTIGPSMVIPILLFGGFFLNISSIPIYFEWISYLSWFRYGNEALMINQWQNVDNINCTISNSTCPRNGHVVLEIFSFSEDNFLMDIIGLLALIFIFRLFGYFALLLKTCRTE